MANYKNTELQGFVFALHFVLTTVIDKLAFVLMKPMFRSLP